MRRVSITSSLVALLLLITSFPAFAADSKEIEALKAAGARAGKLKEGGFIVDIPGDKLTEEVWKQLETLPDLKAFSSSGKQFDDAALARVAKISSIESLFFNGPAITDQGLAVLTNLPNLHKYGTDHGGPKLTGTGLAALAGAKNLRIISFGGCLFNDQGLEALGTLTQLHEVYLGHDRYTSAGLPNLAKLTALEKLRINPNFGPYFSAADLVHLSGLKNLQELNIGQMVLPYEDGLVHLKPLRQLKKLKFESCGILEADLAKLKADLPDTLIDFTPAPPEAIKKWNDMQAKKNIFEIDFRTYGATIVGTSKLARPAC